MLKEGRDYDFAAGVFNCNYTCNSDCSFCFNKRHLNKSPSLTLTEIKLNYFYVFAKYHIRSILISGGEPSIHPQFWDLMHFFYYKVAIGTWPFLNTNSLIFSQQENYKKLLYLLKNSPLVNKSLSLSFSTVNNLRFPSAKERLKIEGFKNTFKAGVLSKTRIYILLAVTKNNYTILPDIADFFLKLIEEYGMPRIFIVQLRGLYLECLTKKQRDESVPSNFEDIEPYCTMFIQKILTNPHIILRIYNLPICLMPKVPIHLLSSRDALLKKELRVRIDYEHQYSHIKSRIFQETSFLTKECQNCEHTKTVCNRIQKEYLDLGYVKKLYPKTPAS